MKAKAIDKDSWENDTENHLLKIWILELEGQNK